MKFKLFITMRTTTSTLFLPKIFWFMREWWDLNYKCFSISFDDEDIYGDNGNAFDDDGDNDNEDAFFDTIFVTLNIVNLIAGIQSNHNLCINSNIFIVTFSPSFDWHLLEEWLVDLNWDLRMETFSCRPAEMKGKCIKIQLFSLKFIAVVLSLVINQGLPLKFETSTSMFHLLTSLLQRYQTRRSN